MTILITGATGLLGSHLYKRLAGVESASTDIIGLTHKECDIRDGSAVYRAIAHYQPDTVFHFAAHLPSTPDPDFVKVNVIGTSNLLDACCQNRVENFIYASSMSVYSTPPVRLPVDERQLTNPDDLYGITKLVGERLCQEYSHRMRTIIIRFFGMFGYGNSRVVYHFIQSALSGQPILVDGDGSQSSDFSYVDNATQGAILALEKGKSGRVYNIGSGQETSVMELANMIAGMVEPRVEVKLSGRPATRPFRFVADISKARKELGYCPGDLLDGIKKYREVLDATG